MSITKLSAASFERTRAPRTTMSAVHTRLREAWPMVGVGLVLLANAAWIGLLGYGLSKLFYRGF